jgi:LacI family transcriptional regulator
MIENKKSVNLKDVAKLANVTLASVDRVINGRSGVSEKTKEKVQKAIKNLTFW